MTTDFLVKYSILNVIFGIGVNTNVSIHFECLMK